MKTRLSLAAGALGTLGLALCLPGCPKNGSIVRPDDPTYEDAVGGQSSPVIEGHGEPLIVDWRPEHRADLEVAMKEGVAVVTYSKDGMRLLKNCHTAGEYGFIGMTLKEQVVSLEDESEIHANLPLSAVGIVGKIGAGFERGTVLNVAMAMVGKRKTTHGEVPRGALTGNCAEATHFVRGALVGAFVMSTGARGKANSAAQIFGMGVHGFTGSAKDVMNKDGDLAACRKADPDGLEPPRQCMALIRLELEGIADAKAKSAPPAAKAAWAPSPCPAGMVMSAGKCAVPNAQRPHQCKPGDVPDCTAQCDRGQPASCLNLGYAHHSGQGAGVDRNRAAQLYQKACELGSPQGCHNLGYLLSEGEGVTRDLPRAATLFEKACGEGEARGCNSLGAAYFSGSGVPTTPTKAGTLFRRACDGGEPLGCSNLGSLHLTGTVGAKNPTVAAGLFERACHGKDPTGCSNFAAALETGNGVPTDLPRAVQLYDTTCQGGFPFACYALGALATLGKGMTQDPARARSLFDRACAAKEVMACATLRVAYGQQATVDPAQVALYRATFDKTCAAGEASDCTSLGILLSATGDPEGKAMMKKSCSLGDAWGCHLSK